eukprot:gene54062-15875_t
MCGLTARRSAAAAWHRRALRGVAAGVAASAPDDAAGLPLRLPDPPAPAVVCDDAAASADGPGAGISAADWLWHEFRALASSERVVVGPRLPRDGVLDGGLAWLLRLPPADLGAWLLRLPPADLGAWLLRLPPADLRAELRPSFAGEIGVGTGVMRDFVQQLCDECFRPGVVFEETPRRELVPPASPPTEGDEQAAEAAGRLLGVALLRGIPVDAGLHRGMVAVLRMPAAALRDAGIEHDDDDGGDEVEGGSDSTGSGSGSDAGVWGRGWGWTPMEPMSAG